MLLNAARMTELRLAARLSQRALARSLGVSSPTITRLEAGRGHGRLTLDRLAQLARALGTTPRDLLAVDADNATKLAATPDEAVAEAALARSRTMIQTAELADGLGWDMPRTSRALTALRARLHGTGSSLVRTPNGWALRSHEALLTPAQRLDLERAQRGRRGITVSDARLLLEVFEGQVGSTWEQRASNHQRVTLASLLKAGYIRKHGDRYELAPAVAATLARQPLPPVTADLADEPEEGEVSQQARRAA